MKLVIDIPDNMLKAIEENGKGTIGVLTEELFGILIRGTPLPKGHGKIVDANRVLENGDNWEVETALMQTEAIIEADKELI